MLLSVCDYSKTKTASVIGQQSSLTLLKTDLILPAVSIPAIFNNFF